MDKTEFIKNLKLQYVDPDDVELEFDSDFRDVESYDSLTGMTVMVMIKDVYGVDISESEYREQKTVKELYEFIKSSL